MRLLFLPLLLLPMVAYAHPHVWITADNALVAANGKITAISMTWTFDEMNGAGIAEAFDANHNGVFDADELPHVRAEAEKSLKEFNYFTHALVNGKPLTFTQFETFMPHLNKGAVHYDLTVKLDPPVDPYKDKVTLGFYDDSYYVDVEPRDPGAPVKIAGLPGCAVKSFEDKAHPVYFGLVFPPMNEIICKK